VNRLFTYIRVVLALAVIFVTVPLYADMPALCTGNGINISRTLYTAPWEEEREADMAVTMIKEHTRNGVSVQDVKASPVHDVRVEGRLLREKTDITRRVQAAIDTGRVDCETLADMQLLRRLHTRTSDDNRLSSIQQLNHTLVTAGFLFSSPRDLSHTKTLAGHRPDGETLALLAGTSALPAPANTKTQKKSRGIARETCSRTCTDGVNLHTYALDTDKVDIFRLVLYRWEDGPFDRPATHGAHIEFSFVIQASTACLTRILRGTYAASHTTKTYIPHVSHTFGLHTHTHNNHTLPAGGLI
jgi:hypothetical protein